MTDDEKEKMRGWVNTWKVTGKLLEELRREEIRTSNLELAIASFDGVFKSALFLEPNKKTSGLVEFHRILSKSK